MTNEEFDALRRDYDVVPFVREMSADAVTPVAVFAALSARGEVIMCQSIRFNNGKRSEGLLCRIAGYIPPAAPGRKSKAQLKALA